MAPGAECDAAASVIRLFLKKFLHKSYIQKYMANAGCNARTHTVACEQQSSDGGGATRTTSLAQHPQHLHDATPPSGGIARVFVTRRGVRPRHVTQ
jgi:hypothetical protein